MDWKKIQFEIKTKEKNKVLKLEKKKQTKRNKQPPPPSQKKRRRIEEAEFETKMKSNQQLDGGLASHFMNLKKGKRSIIKRK